MTRFLLIVLLIFQTYSSQAAEHGITFIKDLEQDAKTAEQQGLMLIVLVTLPDCSVCEYVRTHHIEPMLRAGILNETAIVRELSLTGSSFKDFNGEFIEPERFANRYKSNFSPSVLFLSARAEQLHEPVIGMESADFYGFYLDKAIKKSTLMITNNLNN